MSPFNLANHVAVNIALNPSARPLAMGIVTHGRDLTISMPFEPRSVHLTVVHNHFAFLAAVIIEKLNYTMKFFVEPTALNHDLPIGVSQGFYPDIVFVKMDDSILM